VDKGPPAAIKLDTSPKTAQNSRSHNCCFFMSNNMGSKKMCMLENRAACMLVLVHQQQSYIFINNIPQGPSKNVLLHGPLHSLMILPLGLSNPHYHTNSSRYLIKSNVSVMKCQTDESSDSGELGHVTRSTRKTAGACDCGSDPPEL